MLDRVDHRAHVDAFVERVAHAELVHPGLEAGVEILGDAFLYEKPRTRAADLPLVEPDGVDDALDGAVDIGVVEDDVRRLAAKLERQRLARPRRGLADAATHGGGTGKGDLGDAGMLDDGLPRGAVAGGRC